MEKPPSIPSSGRTDKQPAARDKVHAAESHNFKDAAAPAAKVKATAAILESAAAKKALVKLGSVVKATTAVTATTSEATSQVSRGCICMRIGSIVFWSI